MFTVTPTAAHAVETLVSRTDAPESASVRIARAGEACDPRAIHPAACAYRSPTSPRRAISRCPTPQFTSSPR
jgi:hypothetical protein